MLLKTLVTSLFILLSFLCFTSSSFAQSCEWVEDEQGVVDGFLEVDGQIFRIFERNRAAEILVKLKTFEIQLEEVRQLNLKMDLLQGVVVEQKFMISILTKNNAADRELLSKSLGSNRKWYSQDYVIALASFAIVSLTYGYWSLASK